MEAKEYIVLGRANAVARNQSAYAQLRVTDGNETLTVLVWDVPPTEGPVPGQLVSFGTLRDGMGKKNCASSDMKVGDMAKPEHPLYHLVMRPIDREAWDSTMAQLISFCTDETLTKIIKESADKLFEPYSHYPAAVTIHHAFSGGLLNHTHQMLQMLAGLYPCLPYPIKVERCILTILFHDYGKLREYNPQGEIMPDMYLLGHIYIGAHALQNTLEKYDIKKDEIKRIVHCILAHHGTKEFGSPVLPCLQEATIVNMLDNLSAKTDAIEHAGDNEYVGALGTHVQKG